MSSQNPPTREQVIGAYQLIRQQPPWQHPGSTVSHHRVLPFATLAPWLDDARFMQLYESIREHTLVDIYRCYELWQLAQQMQRVEGDVLEVGVWRGGTGAVLASAVATAVGKRVFLADTFAGVVKAGERDTRYVGGEHADTSLTLVQELMQRLGLQNTQLLQGIFPEDTADRVDGKIAMLHCDVDVYDSCRDVVNWCKPRLSPGAVLVFDDYGFHGCEGVTAYCNELRQEPGFLFLHNLNGHAVFVKV